MVLGWGALSLLRLLLAPDASCLTTQSAASP